MKRIIMLLLAVLFIICANDAFADTGTVNGSQLRMVYDRDGRESFYNFFNGKYFNITLSITFVDGAWNEGSKKMEVMFIADLTRKIIILTSYEKVKTYNDLNNKAINVGNIVTLENVYYDKAQVQYLCEWLAIHGLGHLVQPEYIYLLW